MESTINFIKEKINETNEGIDEIQNVANVERIVSVLAGALITYYGMQKRKRFWVKDSLLSAY